MNALLEIYSVQNRTWHHEHVESRENRILPQSHSVNHNAYTEWTVLTSLTSATPTFFPVNAGVLCVAHPTLVLLPKTSNLPKLSHCVTSDCWCPCHPSCPTASPPTVGAPVIQAAHCVTSDCWHPCCPCPLVPLPKAPRRNSNPGKCPQKLARGASEHSNLPNTKLYNA